MFPLRRVPSAGGHGGHHYAPPAASNLSPLALPFTVDPTASFAFSDSVVAAANDRVFPGWAALSSSSSASRVDSATQSFLDSYIFYPPATYGVADGTYARAADRSSSFDAPVFHNGAGLDSFGAYEDAVGVDSFLKGHSGSEYSDWFKDKPSSIFEENNKAYYSAPSVPGPSGMAYSELCDTFSAPEACNTFDLNTGYIGELHSSSTNRMFHQLPSTSSVLYSSGYNSIPRNGYSTVLHRSPSDSNDYNGNNQLAEPDLPTFYSFARGQNLHAETCVQADNMRLQSSVLPNPDLVQTGLSSNETSADYAVGGSPKVQSELRIANPHIPNSFTSNCISTEPERGMQTFVGIMDQHNLAVDSPCWKGASRQSPFCVGAIADANQGIKGSEGWNSLDQIQNNLSTGLNPISQEQRGSFAGNENWVDPSLVSPSLLVELHGSEWKADDSNIKVLDPLKNDNKSQEQCSNVLSEHRGVVTKNHTDFKSSDQNVNKVGQERRPSPADLVLSLCRNIVPEADPEAFIKHGPSDFDPCSNADGEHSSCTGAPGDIGEPLGLSEPLGKCSTPQNDVHCLVKTMHGLSEMLLSTYCIDSNKFKEDDYKLLQMVTRNIKAFILKSKKGKNKVTSSTSLLQPILSGVANSKLDATNLGVSRATCNIAKEDNCVGSFLYGKQSDTAIPKYRDSNFSAFDSITQVLEKITAESPLGEEENPQTKLYRKLWIDAEIASLSFKYKLQLAQLNAEIGDKHHTEASDPSSIAGKAIQISSPLSQNSVHEPKKLNRSINEKTCNDAKKPEGKTNDVHHKTNSIHGSEKLNIPLCNLKDNMCKNTDKPEKNANGGHCSTNSQNAFPLATSSDIHPAVMARFNILKERNCKLKAKASDAAGFNMEMKASACSLKDLESINGLFPVILDELEFTELGLVDPRNQQPNAQSYTPGRHVEKSTADGSGSPSSSWEHVVEDEYGMV